MKHLGKVLRRRSKVSSSQLQTLDERIKSSPAWKGTVSMLKGQAMLKGQKPFIYMLSEGVEKYHYFLYYVGADYKVHYKNVRIHYVNGVPIYRNGGTGVYENIEKLLPSCLKCSSSLCNPLM